MSRILLAAALAAVLGTAAPSWAGIAVTVNNTTPLRSDLPDGIGGSMIEYHDYPSPMVTRSPIDYQAKASAAGIPVVRMGSYPDPRGSQTLAQFDLKAQAILNSGAVPVFYAPINPALTTFYKLDGATGGTLDTNVAYLVAHYKAAPFYLLTQYWEIGNEPDAGGVDYQVANDAEYVTDFTNVHNTLTSQGLRNNVVLMGGALAHAYHQTNGHMADLIAQSLLTNCHDILDMLTFHRYGGSGNPQDANALLNGIGNVESPFKADRTVIQGNGADYATANTSDFGAAGLAAYAQRNNLTFARHAGLGITEHNASPIHTLADGLWNLLATQYVLTNATVLPGQLDCTFLFDQYGTAYGFGVFNADKTPDYCYWAMYIRNQLSGREKCYNVAVSGNANPSGYPYLKTVATAGNGFVYVEVVNRASTALTDTLSFSGLTTTGTTQVYEMSAAATPNTVKTTLANPNGASYTFPAYSATVFQIPVGTTIPSLVGQWRFEQNLADAAGLNGTATAHGANSFVAGTQAEGAYSLNLPASSYLTSPNNAYLQRTGDLTLAAFVNPGTGSSGNRNVLGKSFNTGYRLRLTSAGTVNLILGTPGSSNPTQVTSGFTVPSGTWSHLAASVHFTAGQCVVKFYLGGILKETYLVNLASLQGGTGDLVIGARDDSGSESWNGGLDDVRIYSVALPGVDVQALAAQ